MKFPVLHLLILVIAVLMLTACDDTEEVEESPADEEVVEEAPQVDEDPQHRSRHTVERWRLTDVDLPDLARPYENILVSSLPSDEQFAALSKSEIRRVINLQHPDEEDFFDPREILEEQGIDYHHIPIAGAEDLTRENVESFHEAITRKEGRALIYSTNSDRAGAMIALRADWQLNVSPLDALRRGKVAGLDELESHVRSELYR